MNFNWFNNLERYDKAAFLFTLFMLLFLLIVGSFHKMGTYGVETDFYWAYAPDAQRIANGEMPQEPGVGPGYALSLVVLNLLFGDWFTTGKTLSILSTVLCGIFTYKTIKILFNAKFAFFTLVLWFVTVLPFTIVASTDMFFAMLVAASLYFLFRGGTITTSNMVLSGVMMGCAFLTRHNAVVLPIGVVAMLLFLNPEGWSWSLRFKHLAVFAGVFLLVYSPWMLLQAMTKGSAVESDSYLIIASNFYGRPGVVASEDMRLAAGQFDSLTSVIFYDFAHFVKHYASNLYRHFYRILLKSLQFPTFLFVGAGAFLLLQRLTKKQLGFFIFPVLSYLLLCLVHYEPRYYLYIISFFVLLAVYFLFFDFNISTSGKLMSITRAVVFGATVFFVFMFSAKDIRATVTAEPRELLQFAETVQADVEDGAAIIARKPHIGFLTGLETKYFPMVDSIPELLDYARQEQARYLFYGEMELEKRPELKILLNPEQLPSEFEPLAVWDEPPSVFYRLKF